MSEDKYDQEKSTHESTKNHYKLYREHAAKEDEFLSKRLESSNKLIEELETSVCAFKQIVSDKEQEIMSMKLHIGSITDKPLGQLHTEGESGDVNTGSTQHDDALKQSKYTKPKVLIMGTSNTKHSNPDKWPRYNTQKEVTFTIQEALDKLESYKPSEPSAVLVYHTLTNDIKSTDVNECVNKMASLVYISLELFPFTKVVISLATPRSDNIEWNDKAEIINIMLKQKYRRHDRVLLCDNRNIGNSGYPKPKMLESDGYHISFDGVVVLAANIKHSIDNAHGAQSSGD